jgi:hypothetical protein
VTTANQSQGLVLYNLFVSLALIFNQYANPIALEAIKWKCKPDPYTFLTIVANQVLDYIVYDVWLLVELIVVYFLFVETSGSSLEEMAAIIDGEAVARVTDGKTMEQREEVMDVKRPHVVVA